MKRIGRFAFLAVLLLMAGTTFAQSLGEAARQAGGAKKPSSTKKVYTNDDIAPAATDARPAETPAPTPATEKADAKAADKKDAKAAEKSESEKNDEWKQKVAAQKKSVADIERELNLMEREHQLRASSYYADIGNQLRDSKKWFEDERKYDEDHKAKQKALADAKQKLDEVKDDARKAGVPAGQLD